MRSSRHKANTRRQMYLALVSKVESSLRDAYAKLYDAGLETQTSLAEKLGVNRSVVNRRLTGQQNMTLETVADMAWALGQCIEMEIYDPAEKKTNAPRVVSEHARWTPTNPVPWKPASTAATSASVLQVSP